MYKNKIITRLIITGDDDFIEDVKNLKVSPSKTWKKNDYKTEKSKLKYKTSGLEFSITHENIVHAGEALKELILFLTPIKKELSLFINVEKTISVVAYIYEGMPSLFYDLESIQFISYINAELDHDIYCLEE